MAFSHHSAFLKKRDFSLCLFLFTVFFSLLPAPYIPSDQGDGHDHSYHRQYDGGRHKILLHLRRTVLFERFRVPSAVLTFLKEPHGRFIFAALIRDFAKSHISQGVSRTLLEHRFPGRLGILEIPAVFSAESLMHRSRECGLPIYAYAAGTGIGNIEIVALLRYRHRHAQPSRRHIRTGECIQQIPVL